MRAGLRSLSLYYPEDLRQPRDVTPPAFQLSYLFLWLESGSTYRRPPADLIPALFTASQNSLSHIGLQLGSGSPTKLITDTFDLVACQIHSLSLTLRSSDELIGGLLSKCVNLAALKYTIKPFTDPLTSTTDPLASLAKAAITTLAVDELMGAIPPYANVLNIVDTISTTLSKPALSRLLHLRFLDLSQAQFISNFGIKSLETLRDECAVRSIAVWFVDGVL